MTTLLYVVLGAVVLIILYVIAAYNGFIRLRNREREAESDIDVQTKRRYDLIPTLIETAKGYMAHERQVLENVTRARTSAMATGGTALDKAGAENQLSQTLKTLFAVSENYPDLKANANFLELQRELADTENKIMAARRFYNSVVRDLNTRIESFPGNLVASMFGFKQENFFEVADTAERNPVPVKF
ncbi:LemA family protein [Candidatus Uhrbacteria bacterium]|nr:LemA family protein [Candidatus Uhrbacteria bacterium]